MADIKMTEWILPEAIPEGAIGFTYLIINQITFQMYIGKRGFTKGWKNYFGSSKYLKSDIKEFGVENFTRGVVRYHFDKRDLASHETNLQLGFDVLRSKFEDGNRMFYNRHIYGYSFDTDILIGHPCHKLKGPKISKALTGRISPKKGKPSGDKGKKHSTPAQLAADDKYRGVPRSEEVRAAISAKNKGKKDPPRSDEYKKLLSERITLWWAKRKLEKSKGVSP